MKTHGERRVILNDVKERLRVVLNRVARDYQLENDDMWQLLRDIGSNLTRLTVKQESEALFELLDAMTVDARGGTMTDTSGTTPKGRPGEDPHRSR